MVRFSVCALLYGDHCGLAKRCLESLISDPGYRQHVKDFRIGLNDVSEETASYVHNWASHVADHGTPVLLQRPFWPDSLPACKYPVMRRLLRDDWSLGESVMWFDDDSYLEGEREWWDKIAIVSTLHMVVGQVWTRRITRSQWNFYQTQPWFLPGTPFPRNGVNFPQGAWWCCRSAFLEQHNWPIPELKHCGGDVMFGELCKHQGVTVRRFDQGVRINADAVGRHSQSSRRGYTEPMLGELYNGRPLSIEHQNFESQRTVYVCH